MIIVSQDKEHIVNFENVREIRIADLTDYFEIKADVADEYEIRLGKYETEERVKAVLKEITKRCMLSERFKAICMSDIQREMIYKMHDKQETLFYYEMPKE